MNYIALEIDVLPAQAEKLPWMQDTFKPGCAVACFGELDAARKPARMTGNSLFISAAYCRRILLTGFTNKPRCILTQDPTLDRRPLRITPSPLSPTPSKIKVAGSGMAEGSLGRIVMVNSAGLLIMTELPANPTIVYSRS